MARGEQQRAHQVFNESQGIANTATQNSNQLYSQLFPALLKESVNPSGYSPEDLSAMNTASQQSVGGATAGAVGEGNLTGARLRNRGSFGANLDEAVRSGQRQLSQNALGVQQQNANLKEAQRQSGLEGLQGLYGNNTNQALSALGLGTNAVNAAVNAGNSGWFQNLMNGIKTTSGAVAPFLG